MIIHVHGRPQPEVESRTANVWWSRSLKATELDEENPSLSTHSSEGGGDAAKSSPEEDEEEEWHHTRWLVPLCFLPGRSLPDFHEGLLTLRNRSDERHRRLQHYGRHLVTRKTHCSRYFYHHLHKQRMWSARDKALGTSSHDLFEKLYLQKTHLNNLWNKELYHLVGADGLRPSEPSVPPQPSTRKYITRYLILQYVSH